MNQLPRREFLRLIGLGVPAVVIEEKFGLWERMRSYFFPSKPTRLLSAADTIALQLEAMQDQIPLLFACPIEYSKLAELVSDSTKVATKRFRTATAAEVMRYGRRWPQ